MQTPALATYAAQKARLLHGDDRKTFGHFQAWLIIAGAEATANGRDFAPRQRAVAEMFGVSFRTAKNWFRRAYVAGLLKPIIQRIQLPDGTWRRIANKYVVALTITLRRVLAKRWKALCGTSAQLDRTPAKPPKTAVSPYVQLFAQQNSAKSDHLPKPPNDSPTTTIDSAPRSHWTCRGCQTGNAWPAPWCRQCHAEKPAHAERLTTPAAEVFRHATA